MRPKPALQMQSRKETIMKVKMLIAVCLAALCTAYAQAQEPKLPKKVKNVEILTLDNKAATLPNFGKKNLLIFYIDPDKRKQNEAFTFEMEENHKAEGENLYGFGIINAADTAIPNGMLRYFAQKRTEKNGATVLTDENHIVSNAWGLGDCNNMFVLLVVSKEGELVYCHKGELSRADIEDFYKFIEAYK